MVSPTKIANLEDGGKAAEYQEALEKIDEIQNDIEKLNEQASEEILKIDQKYDKLRQPFYKKRCEHIAKIPKFWMTTLLNHPQISSIISEEDEEILKHLTEVEIVEMEDAKSGFKINFHFEPNPFFENSILTREIFMSDNPIKPSVCEIKWKEGQNPAEKKRVTSGRKRSGLTDSFFYWFTNSGEGDEGEGMVIDEIGELIKEEIYANPLQYLVEQEGDDDEADEDDGSMGDEELDEEDDDDDEEGDGEGDDE
jgi:hypothetical protein